MKQKKQSIVMKFGGTSVGTPEAIKQVQAIVTESKNSVAVIVSAFAGVTNLLIQTTEIASQHDKTYKKDLGKLIARHKETASTLIKDNERLIEANRYLDKLFVDLTSILRGIYLLKEVSPKILDLVMSYGERLSAYIIAQAFTDSGYKAEFIDSRKLVKTNATFGAAQVDTAVTYKNIQRYWKQSKYPYKIVTGFIASTESNETTALGRGGSDYSASLFGAALKATKIEIWTDVDGVLTADPRKVPSTFSLKHMTFMEAMEISYFGAKVIYPKTMIPAMKLGIPVIIRNTFNPTFAGTMINSTTDDSQKIKGISSVENIALVLIQGSGMRGTPGFAARLFGALARKGINIIFITQASSEYTICFAIKRAAINDAKSTIEEEFAHEIKDGLLDNPLIKDNLAVIAVIGEHMRHKQGVAGEIFTTLAKSRINIIAIAQGSSERNISFVVSQKDETIALQSLHHAFFEQHDHESTIFLLGTGLIGSTLLSQIYSLQKNINTSVVIKGIANSKKMLFSSEAVALSSWQKSLEKGKPMVLKTFLDAVMSSQSTTTLFVDCTASKEIGEWYPKILNAGVSIVTPNKKANSSTMTLYRSIRKAMKASDTKFGYETNVCAGLPTIHTVRQLVETGDTIKTIEGVFSGTLSYIFSTFMKAQRFSEVVRQAQKNGYTEPDPRDDLNGMDVARKLLIMAREAGLSIELKDITVENLVPSSCRKAASIDAFFTALAKEDQHFSKQKEQAFKDGKKLVYIGKLDFANKEYSCKLTMVDSTHPFYSLSGSDNIVSITTKRYNKAPIVIKGPGAGAEVTAAGVLADILAISKSYENEN